MHAEGRHWGTECPAEGRHSIPHSGIVCILDREKRDGLVPDALLRRPTELDAVYKDHLHDMKIIATWPPPATATPWSSRSCKMRCFCDSKMDQGFFK